MGVPPKPQLLTGSTVSWHRWGRSSSRIVPLTPPASARSVFFVVFSGAHAPLPHGQRLRVLLLDIFLAIPLIRRAACSVLPQCLRAPCARISDFARRGSHAFWQPNSICSRNPPNVRETTVRVSRDSSHDVGRRGAERHLFKVVLVLGGAGRHHRGDEGLNQFEGEGHDDGAPRPPHGTAREHDLRPSAHHASPGPPQPSIRPRRVRVHRR